MCLIRLHLASSCQFLHVSKVCANSAADFMHTKCCWFDFSTLFLSSFFSFLSLSFILLSTTGTHSSERQGYGMCVKVFQLKWPPGLQCMNCSDRWLNLTFREALILLVFFKARLSVYNYLRNTIEHFLMMFSLDSCFIFLFFILILAFFLNLNSKYCVSICSYCNYINRNWPVKICCIIVGQVLT